MQRISIPTGLLQSPPREATDSTGAGRAGCIRKIGCHPAILPARLIQALDYRPMKRIMLTNIHHRDWISSQLPARLREIADGLRSLLHSDNEDVRAAAEVLEGLRRD